MLPDKVLAWNLVEHKPAFFSETACTKECAINGDGGVIEITRIVENWKIYSDPKDESTVLSGKNTIYIVLCDSATFIVSGDYKSERPKGLPENSIIPNLMPFVSYLYIGENSEEAYLKYNKLIGLMASRDILDNKYISPMYGENMLKDISSTKLSSMGLEIICHISMEVIRMFKD